MEKCGDPGGSTVSRFVHSIFWRGLSLYSGTCSHVCQDKSKDRLPRGGSSKKAATCVCPEYLGSGPEKAGNGWGSGSMASYASFFVQTITPLVLQLVSRLHSVWQRDHWNQIGASSAPGYAPNPQILARLLDLSLDEKRNLLGYGGFSRNDDRNEKQVDKLLVFCKIWMGTIRTGCYNWVEQVARSHYNHLGNYWDPLFEPKPFFGSLGRLLSIKILEALCCQRCVAPCPPLPARQDSP